MLKHHIKPVSGILVISIFFGYADNITSDRVANFYLSPGFGRRVDIVKTRQNNLESPGIWNCKNPDSNNPDSTNPDNFYIDKTAVHTLTLEEDLKSFQITVKSTAEMKNPVIIIRPLKKDKAILCENHEKTASETLYTEDGELTYIEEFKQDPIPKGTYHILLGSYSNPIDEYKITISPID